MSYTIPKQKTKSKVEVSATDHRSPTEAKYLQVLKTSYK